jgi:hypothetical protein
MTHSRISVCSVLCTVLGTLINVAVIGTGNSYSISDKLQDEVVALKINAVLYTEGINYGNCVYIYIYISLLFRRTVGRNKVRHIFIILISSIFSTVNKGRVTVLYNFTPFFPFTN